MSKQNRRLKRMGNLISILSKYGFKNVLDRINPLAEHPESPDGHSADNGVYTRIRMVLEELGPSFVKLGQAFSNREDMLPKELIIELQQLQDHVELSAMDLDTVLCDNFGPDYRSNFKEIDQQALAAASIAQVYKAVLTNGDQVVLKVKRPNIDEVVESDLLLMKDLSKILTTYFDFAADINLEQAVNAFEKSLLAELSFVSEREHIERFAQNFKGDPLVYVPKVYPSLSNNEVLCMEFIDGAKVTQIDFLKQHGIDPHLLADKGLQLYLKQILEHGFFHADPHAGNIFVLPDGRIAFIDMGAMGTIYQADKELLEDLIIQLISQNVPKLVNILRQMAVRMEVKDEKKLHQDIASILQMVNSSSLENLNIVVLVNKFKDILFENRVIMPDYFTLLVRGLMLIESVGRTLNPNMNLMGSIEPYVLKIIQKRLSPKYLWHKGIAKMGDLSQDMHNIPFELRDILQQLHAGKLTVQGEVSELKKTNTLLNKGIMVLTLSIVLGANIIATAIVLALNQGAQWFGMPVLAVYGFIFSGILALVIAAKVLKRPA